jgi:hypothetical protein
VLRPDHEPIGALRARLAQRVPAITSVLERIARTDLISYEHAVATGVLAGRVAAHMGCSRTDIADAVSVGILHEAAVLEVDQLTEADILRASPSKLFELNRRERALAVAIVQGDERTADLAGLVGSHFDDIAPSVVTRIVVVADIYDYMTRAWPHRPGLTSADALRILSEVVGVRYDRTIVAALSATLYGDASTWIEGPGA